MLKLQIIGNLGADAELRREQGSQFVSLSIAHTERRKNANGVEQETTTWVSATINGDGGNLLPYLKKGTKVYAYGDVGLRLYNSEKDRRMKAGLNLYIRNIELIGAQGDEVPRELTDIDGVLHKVGKYYYCDTAKGITLYNRSGQEFRVDNQGWVTVVAQPESAASTTEEPANETTENKAESSTENKAESTSEKTDNKQKKNNAKK